MGRTCHTPWEAQAFFPDVDSASASTLGVLATPVAGTRDGNQEHRAVFYSSITGGYLRALSVTPRSRYSKDTKRYQPAGLQRSLAQRPGITRGSQYVRTLIAVERTRVYHR